MSGLSCCDVWHFSDVRARARALDEYYPQCQCERFSLQAGGGEAINQSDKLARIVTSPADYNLTDDELLTARLTSVFAVGLSVIRSGASDDEILSTIDSMLARQADGQSLIGAVVVDAKSIRDLGSPAGDQWFGVYATDAGTKAHHADITGTFPRLPSKSKSKAEQDNRRYRLRDLMASFLVRADTPLKLLAALRTAGI